MLGTDFDAPVLEGVARRLFFALWPPMVVREQLANVQEQVFEQDARKLSPDLFHLTLVYMGATDSGQQRCFEQAANNLEIMSFDMTISNTGFFPKPKVAFAGLEETPTGLAQLHHHLSKSLSDHCGLKREARPFNPHVTLLRKYKGHTQIEDAFSIHWQVDRFALVESESHASGVVYRPLRFWPLN